MNVMLSFSLTHSPSSTPSPVNISASESIGTSASLSKAVSHSLQTMSFSTSSTPTASVTNTFPSRSLNLTDIGSPTSTVSPRATPTATHSASQSQSRRTLSRSDSPSRSKQSGSVSLSGVMAANVRLLPTPFVPSDRSFYYIASGVPVFEAAAAPLNRTLGVFPVRADATAYDDEFFTRGQPRALVTLLAPSQVSPMLDVMLLQQWSATGLPTTVPLNASWTFDEGAVLQMRVAYASTDHTLRDSFALVRDAFPATSLEVTTISESVCVAAPLAVSIFGHRGRVDPMRNNVQLWINGTTVPSARGTTTTTASVAGYTIVTLTVVLTRIGLANLTVTAPPLEPATTRFVNVVACDPTSRQHSSSFSFVTPSSPLVSQNQTFWNVFFADAAPHRARTFLTFSPPASNNSNDSSSSVIVVTFKTEKVV